LPATRFRFAAASKRQRADDVLPADLRCPLTLSCEFDVRSVMPSIRVRAATEPLTFIVTIAFSARRAFKEAESPAAAQASIPTGRPGAVARVHDFTTARLGDCGGETTHAATSQVGRHATFRRKTTASWSAPQSLGRQREKPVDAV
jgi:hypothetical protein